MEEKAEPIADSTLHHFTPNGVGAHLSNLIAPAEVEMLVIHMPDVDSPGGAAQANGGEVTLAVSGDGDGDGDDADGAASPTSVSSRIEDESECEEDQKRERESLKMEKEIELPQAPAALASKLSASKFTPSGKADTASKLPPAVNAASSTQKSSAPAPAAAPAPAPPAGAATIPLPPFFTLAFLKVYFSKFQGQHGNAHVLGHRKPLHLFFTFLGATLGIGLLGFLHYNIFMEIDVQANGVFLIGSFGASATLLYGAPTADFSQPRNVWGGHVVSALCGLIIGEIIPDSDTNYQTLRAAFAVAFAIVAMNVTHTVHPPGGATALIAVTPSASIQHLHWLYLVLPVAVGAAIMILVAILVNNCAQSRQYPKYWI